MNQRLSLSETLAHDPQMAIPEYPRIPDDLVMIWDSQTSLVVLGGPAPVIFSGRATGMILPHLLPLMSGEHSMAEIVERLDFIPAAHVHKAISLLYMRGMIEDAAANGDWDAGTVRPYRSQTRFFSRYLDLTRTFRNRYDVLGHLAQSRMLLLTDSPRAPSLLAGLASTGLGEVEVRAPREIFDACAAAASDGLRVSGGPCVLHEYLEQAPLASSGHALIALLLEDDDPAMAHLLNARVGDGTIRTAYGVLGPAHVQLGPVMQKPYSACMACAGLEHRPREPDRFDDNALDMACQHFVLSYVALLTQWIPITSIDNIQTLCPDTLDFDRVALYRQPGCLACGAAANDGAPPIPGQVATGVELAHPLSWFYNENTNFKQYHMVPKGHQAHYDDKNKRAVGGAFKKVENTVVHDLPQSETLPASLSRAFDDPGKTAVANHSAGDDGRRLGMLLSLGAGRRVHAVTEDWQVGFRVTPSAGAMASQNLYLINLRAEGLAKGGHYFSPDGHLECVNEAPLDLAALGLPDSPAVSDAIAAIVIAESYARIESKYVGISYRYTLSDAGAMLGTLKSVAEGLELDLVHTGDFFDDRLAEYLGCKSVCEYPAVLCLVRRNMDGAR